MDKYEVAIREGYFANAEGDIFSPNGRQLVQRTTTHGRKVFTMYTRANQKNNTLLVSRFVHMYINGLTTGWKALVVGHKDHDQGNNKAANLQWVPLGSKVLNEDWLVHNKEFLD